MIRLLAMLLLAVAFSPATKAQSSIIQFSATFDSLLTLKNYTAAMPVAIAWEAYAREQFGEHSVESAVGLGKIAKVYHGQNNVQVADSLFTIAVARAKKNPVENSLDLAELLSEQGINSLSQRHFEAALGQFNEALAIQEKKLGKDDVASLQTLMNIGSAQIRLGEKVSAEKAFLRCLDGFERKALLKHPTYLNCLNITGLFYFRDLQFKQADLYFKKCLKLKQEVYGESHPSYLETLNNLAQLYKFLGKVAEAEAISRKLVDIVGKGNSGLSPMECARIYAVLGIIQREIGIFDQGIQNLLVARDICQTNYPDDPINALIFRELALLYYDAGQLPQSDSCFQQSIAMNEKVYGPSAEQTLIVMGWWAEKLCGRNQPKAATLLRSVEENAKTSNDFSCDQSVIYLHSKGRYAFFEGQYPAALEYFDKAIAAAESTGNTVGWLGNILGNKFQLYSAWEKPENALAMYQELLTLEKELFLDAIQTLTDSERRQIFERLLQTYACLGTLALKNKQLPLGADVANLQIFIKNILESTTRKTLAYVQNSNDPSLLDTYNEWLNARDEVNYAYQLSPEAALATGIDLTVLEANVDSKEAILVRSGVPVIRKEKTTEWTEIRAALQDGEAAVDVMRFQFFDAKSWFKDTAIYAVSIIKSGASQPELVFLENGNELESFIMGQYQNEITRKKELSPTLYEKMWAPIAAHLQGVKTLYFSPDGIFHKINLNTLRAADGTYILDNIEIRQVTNLRYILESTPETSGEKAGIAALFGNPAFKTGATTTVPDSSADLSARSSLMRDIAEDAKGDLHLTPLPGSEREVKSIAKKLGAKNWQPTVFTGAQATEDTLKQLKSPKVLHIATHGYFLNAEKVSGANGLASPQTGKNPALRSMLFFAGAESSLAGEKTGRNDGILTAFEAAVLNLDKTELVVLSACNTGLGKIQNGEGVLGLQRAFRIAGAKSLIMSLWEVEDVATELFMNAFYENWLAGMSKSAAFRKAQLALKAKYPQPFYWGSFILVNG